MKIGNYIIDDEWNYTSSSSYCYKAIASNNAFWEGTIAVNKCAPNYIHYNYELRIDIFYKEYISMFGCDGCFSTAEKAKQRLDIFLNKLNKLAVFL